MLDKNKSCTIGLSGIKNNKTYLLFFFLFYTIEFGFIDFTDLHIAVVKVSEFYIK